MMSCGDTTESIQRPNSKYLDRLRRYDPLLKCVVTLTDDLALKQAERADREFAEKIDRGPLQGIPWGMNDVLAYRPL